jgi:hypothetical protein
MKKPLPLIRNPKFQNQLEKNGYVKINLLSLEAVANLNRHYNKVKALINKPNDDFYSISDIGNIILIDRVNAEITELLDPYFETAFINYNHILSTFLIKNAVSGSALSQHQDWTYVDEEQFFSCNVWVSLQDTTPLNGCMWFIPGSHKFAKTLRASPQHTWTYLNCESAIKFLAISEPLKAGQALVFYHSTIHGSFPNTSNQDRVAIGNCLIEKNSPLLHFYLDSNNKLTRYQLTKQQYKTMPKGYPPTDYIEAKKATFEFNAIDEPEFIEYFLRHNSSWLSKIKAFFFKLNDRKLK